MNSRSSSLAFSKNRALGCTLLSIVVSDWGNQAGPVPALSGAGRQRVLLKLLNFRRHVGSAAYPVGGVAAFENPDFVIGLRAFCVPHCAERFGARNALRPYLGCEHVLGRFPCGLHRRSDHGAQNTQHGSDSEGTDPRGRWKESRGLEMV